MKTIVLVSISIHSGVPDDSKIFDEFLQELFRRRIIKRRDIIYLVGGGTMHIKNIKLELTSMGLFSSYFQERLSGRKIKRTNVLFGSIFKKQ